MKNFVKYFAFFLFLSVVLTIAVQTNKPVLATASSDYVGRKLDITANSSDYDHYKGTRPVVVLAPKVLNSAISYSLIVYFHGYGENLNSALNSEGYIDFASSSTNNYVKIVNNAFQTSKESNTNLNQAIVIMVDGTNCMDGTFFIDSNYTGALGKWATIEVPAQVESKLGIKFSKDPYKRALMGHSMGGYGALRLSQIYNPIDFPENGYGVVAGNNPVTSWLATAKLTLKALSENEKNTQTHQYQYKFTNDPSDPSDRGSINSENNLYTWKLHRLTNLLFDLGSVMDKDSTRLNDPYTTNGKEVCNAYSTGIDFPLTNYGNISLDDLNDWNKNDISTNITKNPNLWTKTHIYFDSQSAGYKDEYYLEKNGNYLDTTLANINKGGKYLIDYNSNYYPNSSDQAYYTEILEKGDWSHFYELTYRTKKSFDFIAKNFNISTL